jgi:uncharacterized protein with HEPN domain
LSNSPRELILHILDEIRYLLSESAKIDFDRFVNDETRKRAFVRSLEVIGEATKGLPTTIREQHPQVEWRSIAAMRDKLIHHYFGVDYEIVWDVITNNLTTLQSQLEAILDRRGNDFGSDDAQE